MDNHIYHVEKYMDKLLKDYEKTFSQIFQQIYPHTFQQFHNHMVFHNSTTATNNSNFLVSFI